MLALRLYVCLHCLNCILAFAYTKRISCHYSYSMELHSPEAKKVSKTTNEKTKIKTSVGYCVGTAKCIAAVVIIFALTFYHFKQFVFVKNYFSTGGIGEISVRDFASDLNTLMCQAYDVSPGSPADVYLVSGRAKIAPNKWNIIKRSNSRLFPDSYDTNNAFYLLEGSLIKVNACKIGERFETRMEKMDILLFRGENSWKEWKRGRCDNCFLERKTLPNQFCEEGGEVLKYQVEDRDTYYVAVTKRNGYHVRYLNVRAKLEIKQTIFDTRNSLQECHLTADCVLNFTYSSNVDIVVKFGNNSTFIFLNSQCKYRVMFWVGVFAILPGCICTLLIVLCCCIARSEKKERKKRLTKQLNDTKDVSSNVTDNLVENELPPARDTVTHTGNIQLV